MAAFNPNLTGTSVNPDTGTLQVTPLNPSPLAGVKKPSFGRYRVAARPQGKASREIPPGSSSSFNLPMTIAPSVPAPDGMTQKGNIDLTTRPTVKNPDGSISTVRSMGFQDDNGDEVLVPTVSDDGRIVSENEAVDNYYKTGKHLGKFSNPGDSDKYAEKLHLDYANGNIPGYPSVNNGPPQPQNTSGPDLPDGSPTPFR